VQGKGTGPGCLGRVFSPCPHVGGEQRGSELGASAAEASSLSPIPGVLLAWSLIQFQHNT
jgi:hypothetical protein